MRSTAGPQLITHLPIDRTSREPLYQQIYEGYRRAILAGHLRPGQRIPSTRALAAELGVSRLPVLAAYEQALKCSHLFNLLDARGAISVTERVGIIARVRKLAVGVAEAWAEQQNPSAQEEAA